MSRHRGHGHRRPRIPRDKRTIPIKGYDDDDGRYFKCWNCGFICDSERDSTSGRTDGVEPLNFKDPIYTPPGDSDAVKAIMGGTLNSLVTMKLSQDDSTVQTIRANFKPDVFSGCPMCGTKNYR